MQINKNRKINAFSELWDDIKQIKHFLIYILNKNNNIKYNYKYNGS